ncbi:hypothetical protein J2Z83_003260 [Virgibacillus natechei]|uniref:DUF3006 domain-containing protein n=1 Tax=Virgibacillus natechei TaxID=1216297 RepID=A0ABS4ILF2_9BACI|nr:DUF3006 domain-containing protein [Virgibacillus natechei]MBP1971121.1 hypothetical protein [Virgibacillus natechei]UZD12193.1 DUF3006 domain-containing protein [Virgibacillus natechei]
MKYVIAIMIAVSFLLAIVTMYAGTGETSNVQRGVAGSAVENLHEITDQPMKTRGMIDRFEGNKAVILIEDLNEELIVPRQDLPIGSKVNTWFLMKIEDGNFKIISIDWKLTKEQDERIKALMEKLREN